MKSFIIHDGKVFKRDMLSPALSMDELLDLKNAVDGSLSEFIQDSVNIPVRMAVLQDHIASSMYKKFRMCVYVMKDQNTGYYKIGSSNNPTYRERTLQSERPVIDLVISVPAERIVERQLHAKYSKQRIRGEWFSLSEDQLQEVENFLLSPQRSKFLKLFEDSFEGRFDIPFDDELFGSICSDILDTWINTKANDVL